MKSVNLLKMPPTIGELSAQVGNVPPQVDRATAMIAHFNPEVLDLAVSRFFVETGGASKNFKAKELIAQYGDEQDPAEDAQLVADLDQTRNRLAMPMRMAAVAVGALILGGGMVATVNTNQSHPTGNVTRGTGSDLSKAEKIAGASLLGGIVGGVVGAGFGFGLDGKEARRKARKIVARAQTQSA